MVKAIKMTNKVSQNMVEGMPSLKGLKDGLLTIKGNELDTISLGDVLLDLNKTPNIPYAINRCQYNFLEGVGVVVKPESITIDPMELNGIKLENKITKVIGNTSGWKVNYNTVGNPTIDGNQNAYNFSTNNYIVSNRKIFNPSGLETWQFKGKFTTNDDITTLNYLILGSNYHPHLSVVASKLCWHLSSNGSAWNLQNNIRSTLSVLQNTTYWFKFGFDGFGYYVDLSTDNVNWITYLSYSNSATHTSGSPNTWVGRTDINNQLFLLTISLQDFTYTQNNELIYTAVEYIPQTHGQFEKGDGKGCKDESYTKWQQPIMNGEYSPWGRCYSTQGTIEAAVPTALPWKAMDGNRLPDSSFGVSFQSIPSNWIYRNNTPFIVDGLSLFNRHTAINNSTKMINIYSDESMNNLLVGGFICNVDGFYTGDYVTIPTNKQTETDSIVIQMLSGYVNQIVGFNEINILARTKYIQPRTKYNVFLISDSNNSNVDVILSTNSEPIMPIGYKDGKFALVTQIQTDPIYPKFTPSFGNEIKFNTQDIPLTITNHKGITSVIYDIPPMVLPITEKDNQEYDYLLCAKIDGTIYEKKCFNHKARLLPPTNPNEGDIYYNCSQADGIAYEYINNTWVEFHDVPLATVKRINNINYELKQIPANNNYYIKGMESDAHIFDAPLVKNNFIRVKHNLDLGNDLTQWKIDCNVVPIVQIAGYDPGDYMMGAVIPNTTTDYRPLTPFLTKEYIGIGLSNIDAGLYVMHKTRGYQEVIPVGELFRIKLVFRIWK